MRLPRRASSARAERARLGRWSCGRPRRTSRRWPSTPSSTPPTNACSAAAAWTAPSTGPRGPGCSPSAARLGGCPTGEAKATKGYDLPARWVIHTVGPIWRGGDVTENPTCWRRATDRASTLAADLGARTLAIPAISTGVYGYPPDVGSTRSPVSTLRDAADRPRRSTPSPWSAFDAATLSRYAAAAQRPVISDRLWSTKSTST